MTRLSRRFPSLKNPHPHPSQDPSSITTLPNKKKPFSSPPPPSSSSSSLSHNHQRRRRRKSGGTGGSMTKPASMWSVYLILSSQLPRTYVGVTTNFSRRLKQHNGELKGGAKATSAGRPWALACIVRGFKDRSEACEFEWKWKSFSRKLPRKQRKEDHASNSLLQHREAALSRVKASFDCSSLQIEWQPDSS